MTGTYRNRINRVADLVRKARETRNPVLALPFQLREADAYAVQRVNVDRAIAAGARRAGYKIGLTSEAVRRQLGAAEPDFGVLFAKGQVAESIDVSSFLQPRIEAEIALVLSDDLPADLDPNDAPRFIAYASAAAEIVDSVFEGWRFDFTGAVADNGCAAAFAIADIRVQIDSFDRVGAMMTMTRDGVPVSSGTGAATMGDPLVALAWLARAGSNHAEAPKAGDVILTGALGPMTDLIPAATYNIKIEGLSGLSLDTAAAA